MTPTLTPVAITSLSNDLVAPEHDDATRREFIVGGAALAALLAAGCTDDDGASSIATGTDDEGARRSVDTARGTVDIPSPPQRLLALDLLALDTALALEVPVAGAAFLGTDDPDVDHLSDRLAGVQPILSADGINLEQVALADPDLILAADDPFYDGIYPQLTEIAPTVLHPEFGNAGRWQQIASVQAELLAGPSGTDRLVSDHEVHAQRVRRALGERVDWSVQLLNVYAAEAYLYLADSFVGQVLVDAGLRLSVTQATSGFTETLSLEQLERVDADILFVLVAPSDPDREAFDSLRRTPLWDRVPAVAAGQVHEVPPRWIRSGYLSAGQLLGDLERLLS